MLEAGPDIEVRRPKIKGEGRGSFSFETSKGRNSDMNPSP
jgi:hypothetical protein